MRAVVTIVFLAAALWRAVVDWQATIGQGYAYRFGSFGTLMAQYWPRNYAEMVASLQRSGVPYAWDPIGAAVMSLPVALVLAAIAGAVWVTREPRVRSR